MPNIKIQKFIRYSFQIHVTQNQNMNYIKYHYHKNLYIVNTFKTAGVHTHLRLTDNFSWTRFGSQ